MKNITSKYDFLKKVYEYSQGIQDYIGLVDYTMLSPQATEQDIIGLCERAKEYGTATVCVLPKMVKIAKSELVGSDVGVCTVVSFPEGTNSTEEKIAECKQVLVDGADEVDMVLNYQKLKEASKVHIDDEDYDRINTEVGIELVNEIRSLVDICHNNSKILKVIVESGLLTEEETSEATFICLDAEADFIKTSTGMVKVGAELNKVKIMYNDIKSQDSDMQIKASGGIRTIEDVKKFAPYVDRFGIGSGSVDTMMGVSGEKSTY